MSKSEYARLTRRRFLKLTSASVVVGGLSSLVSCGSAVTPETPTQAPAATAIPTAAPAPTRALKTLRFGIATAQGPAETSDPARGTSNADTVRFSNCYDQLIWLDNGLNPQPMLAKSWEFNDKADVWTFHLRDNVKFHNGDRFTAKDVVYTYRRIMDPNTASPGAATLSGLDPDGIIALDDYTVQFKLPSPVVDLHYIIFSRFSYVVPDGATADDLRTEAIGTGPFKLERFVPGEDPTVFVKNPDYWMPGLPKVDVFEMRSITETASRLAALEAGQVDIIQGPPRDRLEAIESNPRTTVLSQKSGTWQGFAMQVTEPPYDNNDLRLALKYCIDRQAMVDLVLGGYGHVADDVPVPPWQQYGLQDPPRQRDIQKAKEHLAKAGYPDGIDLELFYSGLEPGWPIMSTILKEQCAEAGINLQLVQTADDTFWSETWMVKPFFTTVWAMRAADSIMSEKNLSTAEWNETDWRRPGFDELIFEARRTPDEAKRTELYQRAQRMIRDDDGTLVVMFQDTLTAALSTVAWSPPASTNFWDFREADIEA